MGREAFEDHVYFLENIVDLAEEDIDSAYGYAVMLTDDLDPEDYRKVLRSTLEHLPRAKTSMQRLDSIISNLEYEEINDINDFFKSTDYVEGSLSFPEPLNDSNDLERASLEVLTRDYERINSIRSNYWDIREILFGNQRRSTQIVGRKPLDLLEEIYSPQVSNLETYLEI